MDGLNVDCGRANISFDVGGDRSKNSLGMG